MFLVELNSLVEFDQVFEYENPLEDDEPLSIILEVHHVGQEYFTSFFHDSIKKNRTITAVCVQHHLNSETHGITFLTMYNSSEMPNHRCTFDFCLLEIKFNILVKLRVCRKRHLKFHLYKSNTIESIQYILGMIKTFC